MQSLTHSPAINCSNLLSSRVPRLKATFTSRSSTHHDDREENFRFQTVRALQLRQFVERRQSIRSVLHVQILVVLNQFVVVVFRIGVGVVAVAVAAAGAARARGRRLWTHHAQDSVAAAREVHQQSSGGPASFQKR